MVSRVKKEHFLPEKSYLDHFAITESGTFGVWTYFDKKQLLKEPEKTTPILIPPEVLCKEHNLYEAPIFPVNAIEGVLATVEGAYKKVIEEKIIPKKDLTEEEHEIVAYFISTLEARTPANREMHNQFTEDVLEKVRSIEEHHMEGRQSTLHKEMIEARDHNILFAQHVAVAIEVNRWRFASFQFLHIDEIDVDQFYITSDHPVSVVDFTLENSIYGVPPFSPTLELTVPLTPQVALFANNIGLEGHIQADPNFVREINNRTIWHARKTILSSQKINSRFIDGAIKRVRQSLILDGIRDELSKRGRISKLSEDLESAEKRQATEA